MGEPPQGEWRARKLRFQVTDPKDLWRACLRSRHARIEIPELEFEIGCNDKRHIDSIYNHIGLAIFELGQFAKSHQDKGVQDKIYDTCISLNEYLDVAAPFHWVIHDPSGLARCILWTASRSCLTNRSRGRGRWGGVGRREGGEGRIFSRVLVAVGGAGAGVLPHGACRSLSPPQDPPSTPAHPPPRA